MALRPASFKVERQHYHLAVGLVYGSCVYAHILVAQPVGVFRVEAVDEAVAELQLGAQLEEWQVDVAAESYFKHYVVAFQPYIVVVAAREVHHGVYSRHYVGPRVVKPRCGEQQVERHAYVYGLHVLRLYDGLSVLQTVGMVVQCQVAVAEI